jgi:hypothetical protein
MSFLREESARAIRITQWLFTLTKAALSESLAHLQVRSRARREDSPISFVGALIVGSRSLASRNGLPASMPRLEKAYQPVGEDHDTALVAHDHSLALEFRQHHAHLGPRRSRHLAEDSGGNRHA